MIRLLLYEDNTPLREGLSMLFNGTEGFALVGAFPNCRNVLAEAARLRPDVVLLDIDLPGVGGIEGLGLIKGQFPALKVVMLTVFDDAQKVFQAMRAGADGYLLKKTPPAKLLDAVQDVYHGGAPMSSAIARQVLQLFVRPVEAVPGRTYALSERERQVLQELVNGHSYKVIAAQLHISLETVRSHIKNIYEKLQVSSKAEAVTKAHRDGLAF